MNHEVIDNQQVLQLALNASSYVTTVVVCRNSLARSGIGRILTGTRFVISEEILSHASEPPTLCLIHIDQVNDELTKTIERLKAQWPSARAVLLTDHLEAGAIVSAFQAGLDGLCSTAMSREVLIKSLELIMLGETYISAAAGIALLERRRAAPQAHGAGSGAPISNNDFASVSTLSGQEAQILHLLTKGASNKLIARDLGVAEATVKVHIKAILRKVRAANRTQAAMWAQQHMNRVANHALLAAE